MHLRLKARRRENKEERQRKGKRESPHLVPVPANRIRAEVDPDANIIVGSTFNQELEGRVRVSVVATGIEAAAWKSCTEA